MDWGDQHRGAEIVRTERVERHNWVLVARSKEIIAVIK